MKFFNVLMFFCLMIGLSYSTYSISTGMISVKSSCNSALREIEKKPKTCIKPREEMIVLENNQVIDNLCIEGESIRLDPGEIICARKTWQGIVYNRL